MVNFKINVFIGIDDCNKSTYNRIGSFYATEVFERYKVFINDIEVSDNTYTFYTDVENNTVVRLKIVDLTNVLEDYEQTFQVYDKDVFMDIILLYNKEYRGNSNYNCFLGVNGENQNEYNNIGDFLGGSNYFEWEISYYNDLDVQFTEVVKVERPRDANGILVPFDYANPLWQNVYNSVGLTTSPLNISIYLDTVPQWLQEISDELNNLAISDGIRIDDIGDIRGRYRIDSENPVGFLMFLYSLYRLQTQQTITNGCCGDTHYEFQDCLYPLEVTNKSIVNKQYCNAEIAIIDIPCSRNKMLYKTSSSVFPVYLHINCDGTWKDLGYINDVYLLDVEKNPLICNKDTFQIKTTCSSEYSDCCGNTNTQYNNECEKVYDISTLPICPVGQLILEQAICKDTLDCDECGNIDSRYITNQAMTINAFVDWNNIRLWHYHNEPKIDNTPFENTIVYYIQQKQKDDSFLTVYTSDTIDLSESISSIEYTFFNAGIYKVIAVVTNKCKSVQLSQDVFIYSKVMIERLDCTSYRLLHCIDRDFSLSITKYSNNEVVYSYDADTEIEIATDKVKVKYNTDYFGYDLAFAEDDIYKLTYFLKDSTGNNTQEFIILHDCFITNCHQEYVKSLLCEGDICDVLLDKCLVTDNTLLKTYMIQKYVLLYDIYKSLASKIVNIEYSHIISPNVLLEDKSCVDLYNLYDIIAKLKEMCVKCGFNITNTDDCGCN